MFIEFICCVLIITTLLYSNNIKSNLIFIGIYGFLGYSFIKKILTFRNTENFLDGIPLCTKESYSNGGFCFDYYAIFIYWTGLIIWNIMTIRNYTICPSFDSIIIYLIHSFGLIFILLGLKIYWSYHNQIVYDIIAVLYAYYTKVN